MSASSSPDELELLAMAYVDGELPAAERQSFEQRLLLDARLARQVAEYRALFFVTKQAAPAEPIDAEWARQAQDPLLRGLQRAGLGLLGLAALNFCLSLVVEALGPTSVRVWLNSLALLSGLAGVLALVFAGWRGRRQELPFDPYTSIKR